MACHLNRAKTIIWWNIVNWTPKNKFQWNPNQNSYIFIQENTFENGVCEMVSILSLPQYVKAWTICTQHISWDVLYIHSLEQDYSNSIAKALELLQCCPKLLVIN